MPYVALCLCLLHFKHWLLACPAVLLRLSSDALYQLYIFIFFNNELCISDIYKFFFISYTKICLHVCNLGRFYSESSNQRLTLNFSCAFPASLDRTCKMFFFCSASNLLKLDFCKIHTSILRTKIKIQNNINNIVVNL